MTPADKQAVRPQRDVGAHRTQGVRPSGIGGPRRAGRLDRSSKLSGYDPVAAFSALFQGAFGGSGADRRDASALDAAGHRGGRAGLRIPHRSVQHRRRGPAVHRRAGRCLLRHLARSLVRLGGHSRGSRAGCRRRRRVGVHPRHTEGEGRRARGHHDDDVHLHRALPRGLARHRTAQGAGTDPADGLVAPPHVAAAPSAPCPGGSAFGRAHIGFLLAVGLAIAIWARLQSTRARVTRPAPSASIPPPPRTGASRSPQRQ